MKSAFVLGHPISHSRSPLIHGHWLKTYGLDGSYERIDVAPVDFGDFLDSFYARGFAGGNVTLPHKEAAFAGVDRRTARAERVKAVNTLWIEDGLRRLGKAEDVAELTAFLCSEKARHIQGVAIAVDGGSTVGYY